MGAGLDLARVCCLCRFDRTSGKGGCSSGISTLMEKVTFHSGPHDNEQDLALALVYMKRGVAFLFSRVWLR